MCCAIFLPLQCWGIFTSSTKVLRHICLCARWRDPSDHTFSLHYQNPTNILAVNYTNLLTTRIENLQYKALTFTVCVLYTFSIEIRVPSICFTEIRERVASKKEIGERGKRIKETASDFIKCSPCLHGA